MTPVLPVHVTNVFAGGNNVSVIKGSEVVPFPLETLLTSVSLPRTNSELTLNLPSLTRSTIFIVLSLAHRHV